MPQIGPAEILVVLLVAMVVFGPKRLPEIGRQVGRGLREVKKLQATITEEIEGVMHPAEPTPAPAAVPASIAVPVPAASISAPVRATGPSARPPSRFRAPQPVASSRG
jgi:sec-independent protein translocase protein TatA